VPVSKSEGGREKTTDRHSVQFRDRKWEGKRRAGEKYGQKTLRIAVGQSFGCVVSGRRGIKRRETYGKLEPLSVCQMSGP